MDRRTLLAALPAFVPTAALAFRQEEAPAGLAADYAASACGQSHDALQVELDALFEGRPVPPALMPRLASLARCPFCGCGLASSPTPPPPPG